VETLFNGSLSVGSRDQSQPDSLGGLVMLV
jgi:hypothetical protein